VSPVAHRPRSNHPNARVRETAESYRRRTRYRRGRTKRTYRDSCRRRDHGADHTCALRASGKHAAVRSQIVARPAGKSPAEVSAAKLPDAACRLADWVTARAASAARPEMADMRFTRRPHLRCRRLQNIRRIRRGVDARPAASPEETIGYLRANEIALTYDQATGTMQAGTTRAAKTITGKAS
jgi:hypothetical protein